MLTTIQELEAFQIIRAIVCGQAKPQRVAYRDANSYCAVLLDDNNRKSIARLHFNTGQKYIGLFVEDKKETRHPIDALEDIFQSSDHLRSAVERFVGATATEGMGCETSRPQNLRPHDSAVRHVSYPCALSMPLESNTQR
ncbi:UNVERIFIED_CONTAM: hypothetical protein RF653_14465 [Kocuria sp. CPCC 205316]|uniref:hypothetical protein n=1 Tax=Kocuria TaxID=57493 RepID=UPI0036DD43FA